MSGRGTWGTAAGNGALARIDRHGGEAVPLDTVGDVEHVLVEVVEVGHGDIMATTTDSQPQIDNNR